MVVMKKICNGKAGEVKNFCSNVFFFNKSRSHAKSEEKVENLETGRYDLSLSKQSKVRPLNQLF